MWFSSSIVAPLYWRIKLFWNQNLQGHVSVVTSICWAADDTKLASVGAGGACYQWNVAKAARIATEEYVDKKKNYLHVAFGEPATVAFTRTMDGSLQSIEGTLLFPHCLYHLLLHYPSHSGINSPRFAAFSQRLNSWNVQ